VIALASHHAKLCVRERAIGYPPTLPPYLAALAVAELEVARAARGGGVVCGGGGSSRGAHAVLADRERVSGWWGAWWRVSA
jgi:hypothetical protein